MDIVFTGVITAVLPMQQGVSQRTGQPWYSQSYLLCYDQGQFPKSVSFSVFGQEKIQQFAIQQGEQLSVHLNIEAKQGQKGYFNDVTCWKVERPGQVQQPMQGQQQPVQSPFPQQGYAQQPMQGQQMQQPMPGQAPFPPQQPMQGQQLPFPPQQ